MNPTELIRRTRSRWLAVVLTGVLTGCVTTPAPKEPMIKAPAKKVQPAKKEAPKPGNTASQASADTMHDLCGAFLLYYAVHRELPPTLEALVADQQLDATSILSPTAGTTFLYEPQGVDVPRIGQRVYVIEAESRQGLRWGIAIDPPRPGVPLVTRVIAVTDSDVNTGT